DYKSFSGKWTNRRVGWCVYGGNYQSSKQGTAVGRYSLPWSSVQAGCYRKQQNRIAVVHYPQNHGRQPDQLMMFRTTIFLVGPMGAGKSTIRRLLASELNLSFRDRARALEER